jgi:alpha-galactosidase
MKTFALLASSLFLLFYWTYPTRANCGPGGVFHDNDYCVACGAGVTLKQNQCPGGEVGRLALGAMFGGCQISFFDPRSCTVTATMLPPKMPVNGTFEGVPGFTIWDTQSLTFEGSCASLPFSFKYGGMPFSHTGWTLTASSATQCTYLDPTGILQVTMDLINYNDFDAIKWVLTFANISNSQNSQILGEVLPGNVQLIADQGATERFDIHYNVGALAGGDPNDGSSSHPAMPDFTPINNNPPRNATVTLQPSNGSSYGGKSSSGVLPYFNIEKPKGGAGVIFAVGWSGQWITRLAVDGTGTNLRFISGQQNFTAQLRHHESIRTPAILMMKWIGPNWLVGQNKFRQLMLEHFSPHDNTGKLPSSVAAGTATGRKPNTETNADLIADVKAIKRAGVALNTFWQDAGWYTLITDKADKALFDYLTPPGKPDSLWLSGAGDWTPDGARFPVAQGFATGYADVSEAARQVGLKSLLWFEPERVSVPAHNYALFASQHQLLVSQFVHDPNQNLVKLFNTYNFSDGNNVNSMVDLIVSRIQSMHLDILRQDMNGPGPLPDWLLNDQFQSGNMGGIARTGITEAGYVAGLYNFWDQLRFRDPNLLIDNCASGERRLDFEALSRTVPLWRSDRGLEGGPGWDPIEQQNQMLGLSLWLPLQGRGSDSAATSTAQLQYKLRSGYGWTGVYAFPWRSISPDVLTLLQNEINRLYGTASPLPGATPLAEIFKGDYYPMRYDPGIPAIGNWDGSMASWVNDDIWVGWEFYRPDLQMGLVQGFRRSNNAPTQFVFYPQGLTSTQAYLVTNLDTKAQQQISGNELMNQGITMSCPSAATSFCTGLFTVQAQN